MYLEKLPKIALSVRQPWAWAIIHAGKDIENRTWDILGKPVRPGDIFSLHASKVMTRSDYEKAKEFMSSIGITCPPPSELRRGGIIGSVCLQETTRRSKSPWFFGPVGFVLSQASPSDFIACNGALGFFKWKPDQQAEASPARWMLAQSQTPAAPLLL